MIDKWTKEHEAGMTQHVHPDIKRYLDTRHLPAPSNPSPYAPQPESEVKPYETPGEALTDLFTGLAETAIKLAPPVGKITAIIGTGVIALRFLGGLALGAGQTAYAWGVANAGAIGAVCVAAVALWVGLSSRADKRANAGQPGASTPPPPNDGGKYEWYQEQNQRQGWRKV